MTITNNYALSVSRSLTMIDQDSSRCELRDESNTCAYGKRCPTNGDNYSACNIYLGHLGNLNLAHMLADQKKELI